MKKKLSFLVLFLVAILGISQTNIPSGGMDILNSAGTAVIQFFDTGNATFTGSTTVNGDVIFPEKAAITSTPGAGYGYLYVENTTPSTLKYVDDTGAEITVGDGTPAVASVNSQTGVVVLDPDDLDDTSTTNKFVTAADITNLSNLSNTNTGDQTITITGDVTGTGTGSFAATIAAGAVDLSMLNVSGTADDAYFLSPDGVGGMEWEAAAGVGDTLLGTVQTFTAAHTWETNTFRLDGSTSGYSIINAPAAAGTGTTFELPTTAGTLAIVANIPADADDLTDGSTNFFVSVTDITNLANLSGTNTGDQTITITGDVAGSGTGSFAVTIQPSSVGVDDLDFTGTTDSTTFARGDGTWAVPVGGGDALTTDGLDQFAATTSDELAGVLNDETGTGGFVRANSPTLVTPALGTPSAIDLTNGTNLPLASGVSGDLPLANLAQFAQKTIAGRAISAGTGDLTALTLNQLLEIIETPIAITSSANAVAWNSDNGEQFDHTLSENTTIGASSGSNLYDGKRITIAITQATGPYTFGWNASFAAGDTFSDTIPAVSTTSGEIDFYRFRYNSFLSKWLLLAHARY